jgi:hypothetical protein
MPVSCLYGLVRFPVGLHPDYLADLPKPPSFEVTWCGGNTAPTPKEGDAMILESTTGITETTRAGGMRRAVTATALTAATVAALLAGPAAPAQASWFSASIGGTAVSLRDCYHPTKAAQPSQSCTFIKTVPAGTAVHIICQHSGQNIYGDPVWNYIQYGGGEGYVADYYVNTGHANWIPGVDVCNY